MKTVDPAAGTESMDVLPENRLFVALLHHPVHNKEGEVVTTSITNLDIHDIARSARTFGLGGFWVVHPIPGMRALADRIVWHWREGLGGQTNPSRREAMALVRTCPDIHHVLTEVEQQTGEIPLLVATSARAGPGALSFAELRRRLQNPGPPRLLILGTGYGLATPLLDRCEEHLESVRGVAGYNHLSVRAAAAILFARLAFGPTGNP